MPRLWPAAPDPPTGANRHRILAVLAGLAIDAAAGLVAAAATILHAGGSHAQVPVFVVACTVAALGAQAVLVPGWILAAGLASRSALVVRLSVAATSLAWACAVSAASAILFLITDSARLTSVVMPLVLAGTAALGVVRAGSADPRRAEPPGARALGIAQMIAAAGAVAVWLGIGLIWALGWIDPPYWANDTRTWWGALAVGPLAVALTGLPPRLLPLPTPREYPPVPDLLARTGVGGSALALLAGLLLLAARILRAGEGG